MCRISSSAFCQVAFGLAMTSKGQRRLGELRWRDRVARGLRVVIGVGECQRTPTPAHVPLDVVGQHAEDKRSAHPIGRAMVDRARHEVDAFDGVEHALDVAQRLLVAHALGRTQCVGAH